MANPSTEETTLPLPVRTAPAAQCCPSRDEATAADCVLCRRPVCRNCRRFVNGKRVCGDCLTTIFQEIEAEKATSVRLLPAIAGGLVAAILCGIAWTAMVVLTDMEIGYAAVGVGLAAGYGVLLAAGKKKSAELQVVAVLSAILGLVLGKYFTVAYLIVKNVKDAQGVSCFDPRLFRIFVELLPRMLSFWDALWAFIALRIAWRIPRPSAVNVLRSQPKA
jgi:hypothetical protein